MRAVLSYIKAVQKSCTCNILGLLNIFNPYAVGICDRGQILLGSEDDFYKKDLSRFLDEFESEIKSGDPYYNVNLTRDSLDYSIM